MAHPRAATARQLSRLPSEANRFPSLPSTHPQILVPASFLARLPGSCIQPNTLLGSGAAQSTDMPWQPVDGAQPDQPLTRPSQTDSGNGATANNAVAGSSVSSNGEARSALASHKGRKLNRTLPQLKRNAACTTCKRRRVRCDSAKPHCASCVKHFAFLARTQPDPERDSRGVQCVYEDDDDGDSEDAPVGPLAGANASLSRSSSDPVAAPKGVIDGQMRRSLVSDEEVVPRGMKRRKDEDGEDGHSETVRTLEARVGE